MIAARIVGKKNLHAGAPSCTGSTVARTSRRCGTVDTALRCMPIICARNSWVSGNISLSHKSRARKSRRDKQASIK
jgi:hypothetical protein